MVGFYAAKNVWSDMDKILNSDFWDRTALLLVVYSMMNAVLVNAVDIYETPVFMHIWNNLKKVLDETELVELLLGLIRNITSIMAIVEAIPGKPCEQIGASFGLLLRKTLLVSMNNEQGLGEWVGINAP